MAFRKKAGQGTPYGNKKVQQDGRKAISKDPAARIGQHEFHLFCYKNRALGFMENLVGDAAQKQTGEISDSP